MKTLGQIMDALDIRCIGPNLDEDPRLRIVVDGISDSGECIQQDAEWELKYPSAVEITKEIIKVLENYRPEIIGWNPNTVEEEDENLTEWQQCLFEEGLIPTEEDDLKYCEKIDDIWIYIIYNNTHIPVVSKHRERYDKK